MRFYFAASYSRGKELAVFANSVRSYGHDITSTWLGHAVVDYEKQQMELGRTFADIMAECGEQDLLDIEAADAVVNFTESEQRYFSGGRHVEFGYALARHKTLIVVGPKENVFHHIPGVIHFENSDQFLTWVGGLTVRMNQNTLAGVR